MKRFTLSKDHNLNYCAEIIKIDNLSKHSNADRLQITNIHGNNVITDLETLVGDVVIYFPVECSISEEILKELSLYREGKLNKDPEKKGLFENNGRVKAVSLRGERSEGFILHYSQFMLAFNTNVEPEMNMLFDTFNDVIICKKYIPKVSQMSHTLSKNEKSNKKAKRFNIVEDQFRFHKDTEKLQNNIFKLKPNKIVQITKKYHGTSGISSKLLVNLPKNKLESITIKLLSKIKWIHLNINKQEYKDIYASRTVIKNENSMNFYNCDIWNVAHQILLPYITDGMTLYYEIIGYLPTGGLIQKGYPYGFEQPAVDEPFTFGKHFGIKIYRITHTNPKGICYELTSQQIIAFCTKFDIIDMLPEEMYYGKLRDIYDIPCDNSFDYQFFKTIKNDSVKFKMETIDEDCGSPFEGVVFRFESSKYLDRIVSYKLKCFRFLEQESKSLDRGIIDIETKN